MRKLIFIIAIMFSMAGYAQIEYPRYETDSLGQKIVLLTVEQAQSLDNNTDLLTLFEKMESQIGDYDSVCLKVVSDKDKVIASQTVQIENLKKALDNKDAQIANLQENIKKLDLKVISLEKEIDNKNKEIGLHLGEIKRVKRNSILGGGIGGAILGAVLTFLIVK
jgi:chromosome segregation ATPase